MNTKNHIPWKYSSTTLRETLSKSNTDTAVIDLIIKRFEEGEEKEYLREYQGALSYWTELLLQEKKQAVIVTLDWRDTAWKWSNIKKVTEQLNNRSYWVTAFAWIPTQEERHQSNWFGRYSASFPNKWSIQFYDRSWYNRAWVEAAMWFCTQQEYDWFMKHVNDFEKHVVDDGYDLLKIYLSIWKDVQKRRLRERKTVRKRWKSSKVDEQAQEKWNQYTLAKQKMLEHTDTPHAPWTVIDSSERFESAVEIIKTIIGTNQEIKRAIESELSIDLDHDFSIVRTGKQELMRMKELWQIPTGRKFHFHEESSL